MKKIFKNRSKLLFVTIVLETVLSLWALIYFNYMDHLNYAESMINNTQSLALMIQNMYTSSWWALIILTICLITIFSLTSFIFKDLKYLFISLCLWIILFILAINLKDSFVNNLATIAVFIPIFILNIFAYLNQKKLSN